MQVLDNGNVQIKNNQTGEVKVITPEELPACQRALTSARISGVKHGEPIIPPVSENAPKPLHEARVYPSTYQSS